MQARGDQIRRQRKECGYSLTAFAHRLGISPGWLSRIERNKAHPSPDVLRSIALALEAETPVRAAISKIARHETEGDDDEPLDG